MSKATATKSTKKTAKKIDPRLELVHRMIDDDFDLIDERSDDDSAIKQMAAAVNWRCFDSDTVKKVFAILFASVVNDSDQSLTADPIFEAARSEHEMTCACCRAKAKAVAHA